MAAVGPGQNRDYPEVSATGHSFSEAAGTNHPPPHHGGGQRNRQREANAAEEPKYEVPQTTNQDVGSQQQGNQPASNSAAHCESLVRAPASSPTAGCVDSPLSGEVPLTMQPESQSGVARKRNITIRLPRKIHPTQRIGFAGRAERGTGVVPQESSDRTEPNRSEPKAQPAGPKRTEPKGRSSAKAGNPKRWKTHAGKQERNAAEPNQSEAQERSATGAQSPESGREASALAPVTAARTLVRSENTATGSAQPEDQPPKRNNEDTVEEGAERMTRCCFCAVELRGASAAFEANANAKAELVYVKKQSGEAFWMSKLCCGAHTGALFPSFTGKALCPVCGKVVSRGKRKALSSTMYRHPGKIGCLPVTVLLCSRSCAAVFETKSVAPAVCWSCHSREFLVGEAIAYAKTGKFSSPEDAATQAAKRVKKISYCSRCHTGGYCSEACQKCDWPQHKSRCSVISRASGFERRLLSFGPRVGAAVFALL